MNQRTYCTNIILLCAIFLCFVLQGLAQTKGLQEVEVDLGSGSFIGEQGLPFDVPFRIRGPITPNLRKVIVKYRVDSAEFKKWMRFPSKIQAAWSEPKIWRYIDEPSKDQKFRLTIGPLHPNIGYDFSYTILKNPSLNTTQRDELKKTIFESLSFFLQDLIALTDAGITQLNNELNNKMKIAAGGDILKNADETDFILNVLDAPILPTTTAIINFNLAIKDAKTDIQTYSNFLNTANPRWPVLRKLLADINSGAITLNEPAKAIWESPVSTSIQAYKDLKFKELAVLLANPALPWHEVILGAMKIDRATLAPVSAPDISSFELLNAFFNIIHSGALTGIGGDVFATLQGDIADLLPSFTGAKEAFEVIKTSEQKKGELLGKFPDVLADKLISLSFVIIDRSVSDVVSQSTPYIGLDFGFSFTPGYSQLFAYEGINFYFTPVNKDAPLSSMKGLQNNLLKRLSVHLGLTQSLIAAENKNYQALINNVGSLLVGAGLRFSRIMRLNYGVIFFYEKNPNPLIAKKDFKSMYTFSLTFDINIAKALGNIGTRLGR